MLSIDHEIIQMPTHKIKKERNISRYGKLLCPGPLPSVGSSFITTIRDKQKIMGVISTVMGTFILVN